MILHSFHGRSVIFRICHFPCAHSYITPFHLVLSMPFSFQKTLARCTPLCAILLHNVFHAILVHSMPCPHYCQYPLTEAPYARGQCVKARVVPSTVVMKTKP